MSAKITAAAATADRITKVYYSDMMRKIARLAIVIPAIVFAQDKPTEKLAPYYPTPGDHRR